MIYLMPFSAEDRTDYELVNEFQQKCVEEKIFGMGWVIPCFPYGTKMTDAAADESDNFACFLAKDGFFCSAEFGALILSYHIMCEDLDRENDLNKKNNGKER